MIECVYYTPELRCYRDGKVERYINYKRNGWFLVSTKSKNKYTRVCIDKKFISIHRLIAFCFLGLKNLDGKDRKINVDHINRDTKNNSVSNLRVITFEKNMLNKLGKGFSFDGKKYTAYIVLNKKHIHLGRYNTAEEARNIYLEAKKKYHII